MIGSLTRYQRVLSRALPLATISVAGLLATGLLLAGVREVGSLIAVLLLALVWLRHRDQHDNAHSAVRAAVIVALGYAADPPDHWSPATLIALGMLLVALMVEPFVEPYLSPPMHAYRLPGLQEPFVARLRQPIFTASCAGGVAMAAAAAGLVSIAAVTVVIACWLAACALVAFVQLSRCRRHLPEREIQAALTAFAPAYYLHFSGTPEAAYQVQMWLPYLERTGSRGALLIRENALLATALRITTMPVLLAESVEPLEYALVPSLGAVFYPNNAAKNVDGTRYPRVTHVHLGHGDSDKPASYASSTAMFDRIFVAGQAGVDRFAGHGVLVPASKFVLVGRPQVEAITVRGKGEALPPRPVVLYAPTWRGVLADMQLSSLDAGERLVAALLDAGARVIFRPHPFAWRDAGSRVLVKRVDAILAAAGSDHVRSAEAAQRTIFECMNASDALVADVSSVASDYLYSNKPFALAHHGTADQVLAEYPLAKAAYLLGVEGDLRAPLADLLGADPRADDRAELRRYYLGPWPAQEYSEVFVAAARDAIAGRPAS